MCRCNMAKARLRFDAVAYPAIRKLFPVTIDACDNACNEQQRFSVTSQRLGGGGDGPYWNIVYYDCSKHKHYSDTNGITYDSLWSKSYCGISA